MPDLADRYTLRDPIGAGAMGDVFTALDVPTGQIVAVKRLKPGLVEQDPTALERFLREGDALRQLDHPNIVKMLDAVEHDGLHYIVTEYIPGGDLAAYITDHHPIAVEDVLRIAIQLADALTRSHFLDIIHRDIKPANVLITADGTPKLSDFGIARFGGLQESPTATGMVVGTYAYLSPEACMGFPPDTRTDIWAFGVVLYELLTGQRPFDGKGPGALVMNILNQPFPDPQELRTEVSEDLNHLLYRILTKQREARIPSIRLVGAEIEAMLKGFDLPPSPRMVPVVKADSPFTTPTAEKPARHNLPHAVTPFVGRQAEMAELQRLLDGEAVRLITLHGPGGMGKSRLALEAGRARLEDFTDGVYFVELAPLSDAANIPNAIAEATGFPFTGTDPPAQQIVTFLANKHMLLILDNFEHILPGRDLVTEILQAAPRLTLIATSRERLNLSAETVFTLGGMDFPAWETPEDALTYSAVKLFMQSAKRARVDFELKPDDLNYLARICRLVEGTPLGILLAAGWVDTLPLSEIAAEIAESVDFLETEHTDLPSRQRSIRAAFEYSWNLLDEGERDAFSRLAVFRGSCSHRAARRVTGAGLRTLTALANKSLLGRSPESGRFEVHELLRQLAEEHLDASGQAAEIRDAHAAYYLSALAGRRADLEGGDQLGAVQAIETDFENVRAAWLWALETDQHDLLRDAIPPLAIFCPTRSRYIDGDALLGAVEERYADSAGARLLWASALLHRDLLDPLGRHSPEGREADYRTVLSITQQAGDRYLVSLAWHALAWLRITQREFEASLEPFQRSLAIANAIGDTLLQALNYHRIGFVNVQLGDMDASEQATREAADLRRASGDLFGLCTSTNNLGAIASRKGDKDGAANAYQEAMSIADTLGDRLLWAFSASNLAGIYLNTERIAEAERIAQETMAIAERYNHDRTRAAANGTFIVLALAANDYHRAEEVIAQQLALNSADVQVLAPALTQRIAVACALGDYDAARAYTRQVAAMIPPGMAFGKSIAMRYMAPLIAQAGDRERAVEALSLSYSTQGIVTPETELIGVLVELRESLKAELGEEAYNAAWERGAAMDIHTTFEQAVREYAGEE